MSIRRNVMPLCLAASKSVRTRMNIQSALSGYAALRPPQHNSSWFLTGANISGGALVFSHWRVSARNCSRSDIAEPLGERARRRRAPVDVGEREEARLGASPVQTRSGRGPRLAL